MPSPLHIAQTLHRDLPPFIAGLSNGLRLDADERRDITGADWRIWTPWTVATFSDGEYAQAVHMDDPAIRSLSANGRALLTAEVTIGDENYLSFEGGELAKRAQTLGAKKDPGSRNRYERLVDACTGFLVTSESLIGPESAEWLNQVPYVPQTRIDADKKRGDLRVRFPGNNTFQYPLGSRVGSVVTFGPGMTGATFAGDMIGRAQEAHLVSGGTSALFIHRWIQRQLQLMTIGLEGDRRAGRLASMAPGIPPSQVRVPEAFFYDDGIAASIGIVASRTVERGKPVDAVVMSAVHSAGRTEAEAGVDGAHQLLGDGGLLVVKAPRASIGDEGGMDVIASRAMPIFGSPVAAGEAGQLKQYRDPTLPLERPADFAIFQKQ